MPRFKRVHLPKQMSFGFQIRFYSNRNVLYQLFHFSVIFEEFLTYPCYHDLPTVSRRRKKFQFNYLNQNEQQVRQYGIGSQLNKIKIVKYIQDFSSSPDTGWKLSWKLTSWNLP